MGKKNQATPIDTFTEIDAVDEFTKQFRRAILVVDLMFEKASEGRLSGTEMADELWMLQELMERTRKSVNQAFGHAVAICTEA